MMNFWCLDPITVWKLAFFCIWDAVDAARDGRMFLRKSIWGERRSAAFLKARQKEREFVWIRPASAAQGGL